MGTTSTLWTLSVLAVLLQSATEVKSSAECSGSRSGHQSLDVSIRSRKNATGKWVTDFVASKLSENEVESVVVDLKQKIFYCDGKQIVSIQGIIYEDPQNNMREEVKDRLTFYPKCGRNVVISNNGRTVRKINVEDRYNSVVFTNRPVKTNELFEIRVDNKTKGQFGYFVGIGFTRTSPQDIGIPTHMNFISPSWLLYHANSYINGAEHKLGNKINLDQIQVGHRFGIKRTPSGALHLYVDGTDEGPLLHNIPENVYGVFEIYGDMGQYTLV